MIKGLIQQTIVPFIIAVAGIFLMGSIPYLLFDMEHILEIQALLDSGRLENTLFLYQPVQFDYELYWQSIMNTAKGLIHVKDWTYLNEVSWEKPLFPIFQEVYLNTLLYLGIALLASFIFAIFNTYLIMLLSSRIRRKVKFIFFVIESLPDLFIIISLQMFVIWFFKKTDILLFNIVSSFGEEAFLLPLIVLSFLPTIYMTRYLLLSFEDEYQSLYVELARGKGLTKTAILFVHIFRNAYASFVYHYKTIFWFTLSNLVIIEIVLNVNGLLRFIWTNCARNPELLTLSLLCIFVPFFLVLKIMELFAKKNSIQGVVE
ncbi:ABC transporter permease subunit [Bacillus suaedaesalsae]|uniref:ABC transporter permease subunit n=1 Tax=Bacillus suaedaesalsae TaxID=2810349 RepID=A0ABS2DK65_9BACI|nr:ABC transporter permease subunit [Bacillus suaedaesalsae]MBM6618796.1 ABC transporter permease subunit [Bacillus suaedaesalsae]